MDLLDVPKLRIRTQPPENTTPPKTGGPNMNPRETLQNLRDNFKTVTRTLFWTTIGSITTLYTVAPTQPLTKQVLPLEIGLLIGVTLGYLSYREPEP